MIRRYQNKINGRNLPKELKKTIWKTNFRKKATVREHHMQEHFVEWAPVERAFQWKTLRVHRKNQRRSNSCTGEPKLDEQLSFEDRLEGTTIRKAGSLIHINCFPLHCHPIFIPLLKPFYFQSMVDLVAPFQHRLFCWVLLTVHHTVYWKHAFSSVFGQARTGEMQTSFAITKVLSFLRRRTVRMTARQKLEFIPWTKLAFRECLQRRMNSFHTHY